MIGRKLGDRFAESHMAALLFMHCEPLQYMLSTVGVPVCGGILEIFNIYNI